MSSRVRVRVRYLMITMWSWCGMIIVYTLFEYCVLWCCECLSFMTSFRTEQCKDFLERRCEQRRPYTCFKWHFPNQRRRRPVIKCDGSFNYSPNEYCTEYNESTGICPNGDRYTVFCFMMYNICVINRYSLQEDPFRVCKMPSSSHKTWLLQADLYH